MSSEIINKQFKGFINTPNLWLGQSLFTQSPFILKDLDSNFYSISTNLNQRLGKRLEQFMAYYLEHDTSITSLKKGLQIKSKKQTIGELDFLFYKAQQVIHLELAYKFYLHDPSLGDINTIESWTGPNKKDNLLLKSEKLRHLQFPLLYKNESIKLLKSFKINPSEIQQHLCFKAQLYLPYNSVLTNFKNLNPNCVAGYYLQKHQLAIIETSEIYIPEKLNWVSKPNATATYRSFQDMKTELLSLLKNQRSPLLWVKSIEGEFSRCFVVWW